MNRIYLTLSAIGRAVVNWNDRHYRPGISGDFRRVEQSALRQWIGSTGSRLYVLGDLATAAASEPTSGHHHHEAGT